MLVFTGVLIDGKLSQKHSPEEFDTVIGTNLRGPWLVANEIARQWMLKNGGNIVMVSSITARRPVAGSISYLSAKAGLDHMTKTLALEWAPRTVGSGDGAS